MAEQLAKSLWQQQAANAALRRQARETTRAGEHMLPVQHNMNRRCLVHDYSGPGYYHITLRTENIADQPFGQVLGDDADTAHVLLSPVGQMVEQELLHTITTHYPMVEVQDYAIMPEHMHFILYVHSQLQSKDGKVQTLGRIISGFKYGCTRRWLQMQQPTQPTETVGTPAPGAPTAGASAATAPGVLRFSRKGKASLFAKGYTDVMPLHAGQLDTQRAYIKDNPRMRWLRTSNHSWLSPKRGGVDTALSVAALRTYLRQECRFIQATDAILNGIEALLLQAPAATSSTPADGASATGSPAPDALLSRRKDIIDCDTYGNRSLLDRTQHRLLPLVCHRKDAARLEQQTQAVMTAAKEGAIIVSACINPHENTIFKGLIQQGFPVIKIEDNGFPEVYHPSAERQALCSMGKYLIVAPWRYHYRNKDQSIYVAYCKTMNCVAQALCRTKDTWWMKENSINR